MPNQGEDTSKKSGFGTSQIATFQVSEKLFGISIEYIKEIVEYSEITAIPQTNEYIRGVMNLRGEVLPVIDARIRLGLEVSKITENTRILVIHTRNASTGVIVDNVLGVINVNEKDKESPSGVLDNGLDVKNIKSIIKDTQEGEMIMELDADILCYLKEAEAASIAQKQVEVTEEQKQAQATQNELQLVTFKVGREEYAFPMEAVREIVVPSNIIEVPEIPDYALGVLSLRNSILPVIDIRKLFKKPTFIEYMIGKINSLKQTQKEWLNTFQHSVVSGQSFNGTLNHEESELDIWLDSLNTSSETIGKAVQESKFYNQECYSKAQNINHLVAEFKIEEAKKALSESLEYTFAYLQNSLDTLANILRKDILQEQRIMVIELGSLPAGILVDDMHQVLRIPESIVAPPPKILSTNRTRNLKGIVQLENGKRIILLLDENNLLDHSSVKDLHEVSQSEAVEEARATSQTEGKEDLIQVLTFNLDEEELAIPIEDIQEINMMDNITAIPRSQSFMEGIMNLRGNVIPIIDLRKRFEMESIERDDYTRVIVVDLKESLMGMIVDSVNEVLRLSKSHVEPPPAVISSEVATTFIKGLGKIENGKRIIILMDVNQLLSSDEKNELQESLEPDLVTPEPPAIDPAPQAVEQSAKEAEEEGKPTKQLKQSR